MDMSSSVPLLLYLFVVIPVYCGRDLNQSDISSDGSRALASFSDTYKSVHGDDMNILGLEPTMIPGGLPVFIWLMGSFSTLGSQADNVWLQQMALRGFIAAAVDYVSFSDRLAWSIKFTGSDKLFQDLEAKAQRLPNAISKVCSRPRADCSQGVAVAGHSSGGFITIFSLQHDSRITAIMALSVGCLDGKLASRLTDVEVSKYLPPSKRLYITGSRDRMVGPECLQDMSYELQADGSGYIVLPEGPHQFYASCDPVQLSTLMKCSYSHSVDHWGLAKTLNWLAQAASPACVDINAQNESSPCEKGLAISETPKCTGGRNPWIYIVLILIFVVIFPVCAAIYCCLYPAKKDPAYSSLARVADDEVELLRRFSDGRSERHDFRQVQRQELEHLESFVSQQPTSIR